MLMHGKYSGIKTGVNKNVNRQGEKFTKNKRMKKRNNRLKQSMSI